MISIKTRANVTHLDLDWWYSAENNYGLPFCFAEFQNTVVNYWNTLFTFNNNETTK